MNSGIYKIINKVNGKYYVGRSANLIRRWIDHKKSLNGGYHKNAHLQSAWNKYGADAFEFVVIEYIDESLLKEIEQKYINKFIEDRKNGIDDCYNISESSESGGFISEEVNKKISEAKKGKTLTIESRQKISKSNKGKKRSEETRKKLSESLKGKYTGEKSPMYGKTGVLNHLYGIPLSTDHKRKISDSMQGDLNHFYGKKHTHESRQKISDSLKCKMGGLNNPSADRKIYTFKNILTNETYTGTRYEFRKAHNISRDSAYGLIIKKYSLTKTGWTLQENHSDQSFPQPL